LAGEEIFKRAAEKLADGNQKFCRRISATLLPICCGSSIDAKCLTESICGKVSPFEFGKKPF
jgi:hypothetical protein